MVCGSEAVVRKGVSKLFTIGFSYIGCIFLLLLFVPNALWTKCLPIGYDASKESQVLVWMERIGQVLVTIIALLCADFNLKAWSTETWWLILASLCMFIYELWWIRYFKSQHTLTDFYTSIFAIPVAGATLPVLAFFCLGMYGHNLWMILSVVMLGIGHIGIHIQHRKEI